MMFKAPEEFRVDDAFAQRYGYPDAGEGNDGLFLIKGPNGARLFCIAAEDGGWEHVSISRYKGGINRPCPQWEEMDFIKRLFWTPDAVVMQIHPAEANHINRAASCLHLWRPSAVGIPLPPIIFV